MNFFWPTPPAADSQMTTSFFTLKSWMLDSPAVAEAMADKSCPIQCITLEFNRPKRGLCVRWRKLPEVSFFLLHYFCFLYKSEQ